LEYPSPGDAIELGVYLSEKDKSGNPRWHWHSDIRCDEIEDFQRALLRPLIRAAIDVALSEAQSTGEKK
jgi:hypothetical protein